MHTYTITVTQLVSDENLSKHDDRLDNPSGSYRFEAWRESDALDEFHNHIGIGCLDDFRIDVSCNFTPTEEQIGDWKYQVANNDTRLGFDDWIASQFEAGAYPGGDDADEQVVVALTDGQADFVKALLYQAKSDVDPNDKQQNDFIDTLLDQVEQSIDGSC